MLDGILPPKYGYHIYVQKYMETAGQEYIVDEAEIKIPDIPIRDIAIALPVMLQLQGFKIE